MRGKRETVTVVEFEFDEGYLKQNHFFYSFPRIERVNYQDKHLIFARYFMISLRRCNRFHLSIFFSSGWFAELQWERWAWHTGTQCNSLVRKWFFQLSNAIKIRRELSTNLVASQHKWIDFLLLRKKNFEMLACVIILLKALSDRHFFRLRHAVGVRLCWRCVKENAEAASHFCFVLLPVGLLWQVCALLCLPVILFCRKNMQLTHRKKAFFMDEN